MLQPPASAALHIFLCDYNAEYIYTISCDFPDYQTYAVVLCYLTW